MSDAKDTYESDLRSRLGVPEMSMRRLPEIATSGNFAGREAQALMASLRSALDGRGKLPGWVRDIKGMSGQRYRTLVNTLVGALDRPRYLEIGSWLGSTVTAAAYGNHVQAVCIENWSQLFVSTEEFLKISETEETLVKTTRPREHILGVSVSNEQVSKAMETKRQFLENVARARSSAAKIDLIEQDFRKVDYSALGPFNIYLFDGPHSEQDHIDGILIVQPCLADGFVVIVDDWNWSWVRKGTLRGLLAAECRVEASLQVRTTSNEAHPAVAFGASDWHNGYFIAVCSKGSSAPPH